MSVSANLNRKGVDMHILCGLKHRITLWFEHNVIVSRGTESSMLSRYLLPRYIWLEHNEMVSRGKRDYRLLSADAFCNLYESTKVV